ncbi:DJ-1/PfpI family protein [Gloeobacter morelensis]|uniref:DJ-1/PfpI family protein n=1 Tax=Gloeobacter morelensis MG652769 TaxID=2781736 RepID=A0ABY3PT66_9CYAN|nr:DJ-1/PfpI family protein [Gloeobacter morelensis MG652769]
MSRLLDQSSGGAGRECSLTRRALLGAAALGALGATAGEAASPVMPEPGKQPTRIAMLVYPGFTLLDLVGPHTIFTGMMHTDIQLVWKTKSAVESDTGVTIQSTATFEECPDDLDILFAPGGSLPTVELMDDARVTDFLARKGERARWVTSVCTGSLLLGAAGLLKGYRATSHWVVRDVLAEMGARPVEARVVEDRNRITAGGVTAGIDFGLRLAAKLRGEEYAKALQLAYEYDPEPPFAAGSPRKAGEQVTRFVRDFYASYTTQARAAAQRAQIRLARETVK